MIKHIQKISNVGPFDNVSSVPFSAMTLIYAENGRGKTTLANILRSLSVNEPSLITERKRLQVGKLSQVNGDPHIIVETNNSKKLIFQDGMWKNNFPKIVIFDDNFVVDNIYSGITVETEHKQKLHELILGANGIALNNILKGHISKIEEHNSALKKKKGDISAKAQNSMNVEDFCALQKKPNIDAEIQKAERSLAAAKDADSINKQGNFLSFELPAFDTSTIESILQSDLPELQAAATAKVQNHLKKIGENAEAWISEGMQKIITFSDEKNEDICPFCEQELQHSDIIAHYEAYFSDSYAALKRSIIECGKLLADAHNGEIRSTFERTIREAVQKGDFWRKFMGIPPIQIDTAEIARAWTDAREPILRALRLKLASPLEKRTLCDDTLAAVERYNKYRATISQMSSNLLTFNAQIEVVKEKSSTSSVVTLTADLNRLKTIKERHEHDMASLCEAYLKEKGDKTETEKLRDQARNNLEQYRINVFATYENAINNYLGKFNAGFRLDRVAAQNNRSGSSCTYNVLINNVAVPLANNTGPSFKTTMSAGDRNTLALAFFFASLYQDAGLDEKTVVIDDPMTSLDEHRSLVTIQEIKKLANSVQQVILLSHSKPFLHQMWGKSDKSARTSLQIIRRGAGSAIGNWDLVQDSFPEHDKRYKLIDEYLVSSDSNREREVACALRYVLEAFLRVSYPINFPPEEMLGKFHSKCVKALENKKPILNQTDTEELRRLLDYANKFHHETNAAYATANINDQELVDHCRRTLVFTKRNN